MRSVAQASTSAIRTCQGRTRQYLRPVGGCWYLSCCLFDLHCFDFLNRVLWLFYVSSLARGVFPFAPGSTRAAWDGPGVTLSRAPCVGRQVWVAPVEGGRELRPSRTGEPVWGTSRLSRFKVDVGFINGDPPLQGQQGLRSEVFEDHIPLIKMRTWT